MKTPRTPAIPAVDHIGWNVRGSEYFANNMRAHLQRKGPSNTMRLTAMAAAFASLLGAVLALLVASF